MEVGRRQTRLGDVQGRQAGRLLVLLHLVLPRHAHGDAGPHARRAASDLTDAGLHHRAPRAGGGLRRRPRPFRRSGAHRRGSRTGGPASAPRPDPGRRRDRPEIRRAPRSRSASPASSTSRASPGAVLVGPRQGQRDHRLGCRRRRSRPDDPRLGTRPREDGFGRLHREERQGRRRRGQHDRRQPLRGLHPRAPRRLVRRTRSSACARPAA